MGSSEPSQRDAYGNGSESKASSLTQKTCVQGHIIGKFKMANAEQCIMSKTLKTHRVWRVMRSYVGH